MREDCVNHEMQGMLWASFEQLNDSKAGLRKVTVVRNVDCQSHRLQRDGLCYEIQTNKAQCNEAIHEGWLVLHKLRDMQSSIGCHTYHKEQESLVVQSVLNGLEYEWKSDLLIVRCSNECSLCICNVNASHRSRACTAFMIPNHVAGPNQSHENIRV